MSSDQETLRVLMEIKSEMTNVNVKLEEIKDNLITDRSNLWKILALTIIGAFALIGVKLVFP